MTEKIQNKVAGILNHNIFWTYLTTLIKVMSWKIILALVLMVCLSLAEGIGLLMLVPMLGLIGLDVQQGSLGQIDRFILSVFGAIGIQPTLLGVLAILVLILSTTALLRRWQTVVVLSIQHEFVVHLRLRLYRAIANTKWLFFSRNRSSDFTHVLTNEMGRVGAATGHILRLVASAIVTVVYIILAFKLSVMMTGLVIVCGVGLLLALKSKTQAAQAAGTGLSQAMQVLYASITEHLNSMKLTKSYGAEDRHADIFSRHIDQVRHMFGRAARNQAEVKAWFDISSVCIVSVILYVSVEVLAVPATTVLLLLFLSTRVMPRFSTIQTHYQGFISLLPAFESVVDIQTRCTAAAEAKAQGTEKIEFRHAIQFERVSFSYEEAEVIHDLDLSIRAGETTAIVGPSGAGKSTVADLTIGLITPDKGRVLVDGILLSAERMKPWREQIGYVTQETFLFHDTVRANLLWANPGATEEEIYHSLRLAAAEEFVSKLPNGLDTVVGDRGVRLSGGERQRLALARALLCNPSLLLLDEATSALDSEHEERIQHAIQNLHGSMTILVISHRLSTVRQADTIFVLDEGRLVESGTWDSLIEKENGRFQALCRAQGMDDKDLKLGGKGVASKSA